MSLRVVFSGIVALGLTFLIFSTASAQRFNPGMQRMQSVKTGGTLVAVATDRIQISTNTNQKTVVMIRPETEVSVTGTAQPDYLKSGVNVEFVAEVDQKHVCKDKIVKLLVVSLTSERPAGLFAPEFATPDKKGDKGGLDEEKAKPPAQRRPRRCAGQGAEGQAGRRCVGRRFLFRQAQQGARGRGAVPRHVHRAGDDQNVQGRQDYRVRRPRADDQGRAERRRHDRR